MKALEGGTRTTFYWFFVSHIFFSLLVDSQIIIPEHYIPSPLLQFNAWYSSTFKDELIANGRNFIWFQSLILCEQIFQVPFFFVAVYYISNTTMKNYPVWFGPLCMAYGSHTATTLVPILASVMTNEKATFTERMILCNVYLPYLILPSYILYIAAVDHIETYGRATKTLKTS